MNRIPFFQTPVKSKAVWWGLVIAGFMLAVFIQANHAHAQSAQWIWSPEHSKNAVPQGACYFRKEFTTNAPQEGKIVIAADDEYELYLNGQRIGAASGYAKFRSYDITQRLQRGRNVIAVRVNNVSGKTAALAARVTVKDHSSTLISHSTNSSWKTNLRPFAFWQSSRYGDRRWTPAQQFGPLVGTLPWLPRRTEETAEASRFHLKKDFEVQLVAEPEKTGSLICMTFNEFGEIIAAKENGGLILIEDTNGDKIPDKTRDYCSEIKNCQGLLALNGDVFAIGDGPDGPAIYRLSDDNDDRQLRIAATLLKFKGEMGEHGAHGLVLGADGFLYTVIGNHTTIDGEFAKTSPHHGYYEGDLIQPRYQDPGGHADGVTVPAGTVIRTDTKGTLVELVAGGLRNPYDLALNSWGDLFTHDSDMEWDKGTTWYRPTRVNHVTAGAEFGWRSGWAKWPEYYLDSLPGISDTGRGSPTGAVVYNHTMFPTAYRETLFLGDWAQGRILACKLKRDGGSYEAKTEVFLTGEPLNVTDLEVGPEGALYFTTGGRKTEGGVYRVVWKGEIPAAAQDLGEGMARAIRQPQIHSAWARQALARIQQEEGERWNSYLPGLARTTRNPARYRTRALDLMQLFGPTPTSSQLISLAKDLSPEVRGKAVDLLAMSPQKEQVHATLVKMLRDKDAGVVRRVCEALDRRGEVAPVENILPLLTSDDRFQVSAARRLLERVDVAEWRDEVLKSDQPAIFLHGSIALLIVEPNREMGEAVLASSDAMLDGFVSDSDFVDLLRVIQVAIHQAALEPDALASLAKKLGAEFPATNPRINRELIRILAFAQERSPGQRYIDYLESDIPDADKLHTALYLGQIRNGWTSEQKLKLLKFYDQAIEMKGGNSLKGYVQNVSRKIGQTLTDAESVKVLQAAAEMPNAALLGLFKMPAHLDEETLNKLIAIDESVAGKKGDSFDRLRVGIVAVLARSGDEASTKYLHQIFEQDPERRHTVAVGLSRSPEGENWHYLVRSLSVVEEGPAQAVLMQLANVNQAPDEAKYYRQVILRGLKLKESGGQYAVNLLEHWTGEKMAIEEGEGTQESLAKWQQWFAESYPEQPDAKLPSDEQNTWSFKQIHEFVYSEEGKKSDARRGHDIFTKAQCSKCHRLGNEGETIGPDLTSIAKRFQRREILESVLYPSHAISDQYQSKTIVTVDGRMLTGMMTKRADGKFVLLQSNAKTVILDEDDIEETKVSKTSAMPEGLLNTLSLPQIADLMEYLTSPDAVSISSRPAPQLK